MAEYKDISGLDPIDASKADALPRRYSCVDQHECVYPLPGKFPYKLTNTHPELYDLYFETTGGHRTLITGPEQSFSEEGNIVATRIPLQILYIHEIQENGELKQGFYGCTAPDYLTVPAEVRNELSCSIERGYFCSPSVAKDNQITINEWSQEPLSSVGYKSVAEDIAPEDLTLELRTELHEADQSDRNNPASITPGRNVIPNANLNEFYSRDLLYWQIYDTVNQPILDETIYRSTTEAENGAEISTLTLNGETLQSAPIAISSTENMYFTHAGTCPANIIIVNKNGVSTTASPDETGKVMVEDFSPSYLILLFTGSCTVQQPMLQYNQETPVSFTYNEEYLSKDYPRSGVACCPENYCWNGFACVAPMETSTIVAEHVSPEQNYRCVQGVWTLSQPKYDWNAQRAGFCNDPSQCFVLSSTSGEVNQKITASLTPAEDQTNFYQQSSANLQFPTCVNNQESIMDHFCDQGNWTSRTKFLAGKLLELVKYDSQYSLYCASPQEALNEIPDERLISGESGTASVASPNPLGGTITVKSTCFQIVPESQGAGPIPVEENNCINNVCILKDKNGQVVFATTLNKPINDPEYSFLRALGVDSTACSATTSTEIVDCVTETGKLQYLPQLNAIIYGREGISTFKLSDVDNIIVDFLKNFLGLESAPSPAAQFIGEAQNFRNLFLLKNDDKEARAVLEKLPKKDSEPQQALIAEYENFKTPVCSFTSSVRLPQEFWQEIIPAEEGKQLITCTEEGSIQHVEAVLPKSKAEMLQRLWPQLTGKLRPEVK